MCVERYVDVPDTIKICFIRRSRISLARILVLRKTHISIYLFCIISVRIVLNTVTPNVFDAMRSLPLQQTDNRL
jgi:hypothetical protein